MYLVHISIQIYLIYISNPLSLLSISVYFRTSFLKMKRIFLQNFVKNLPARNYWTPINKFGLRLEILNLIIMTPLILTLKTYKSIKTNFYI